MFKSIRWTLQLYHAAILFMALASFGAVLYLAAQRTTYSEIDNELAAAARVFSQPDSRTLQSAPPLPSRPESLQLAMASQLSSEDSPILTDASPISIPTITDPPAVRAIPAWLKNIPQDCLSRLGWKDSDQPYFIVWNSDGSIIRRSSQTPEIPIATVALTEKISSNPATSAPQFRQRGDLREVLLPGPANSTILVGRSINSELASLANLRLNLIGAGALVMAVGLLGGSFVTSRVLRPIHTISQTARSISASDLSRRIDRDDAKSELGSLVQTLNQTFDRLESAFHRQAQFTADASHELRTPLTVIHAGSELALRTNRTGDEYRRTIESSLRASKRMQSLVESLLTLARADASAMDLRYANIDLRQVAGDCATLLAPVASKRNIRIEITGDPTSIEADQHRILQLITNLMSNAIQYNRDGGSVRVTITPGPRCAILSVADTGIGIAPHDQPQIFQRFFRAEKARSRDSGGCGLGLAICKSITRAHGGSITFASRPDAGTTFVVRLPITRADGCFTDSSDPDTRKLLP